MHATRILGGLDGLRLRAAAAQSDVPAMLAWMSHARSQGGWDALGVMVDHVAPSFGQAALDVARGRNPNIPDLSILRAATMSSQATGSAGRSSLVVRVSAGCTRTLPAVTYVLDHTGFSEGRPSVSCCPCK